MNLTDAFHAELEAQIALAEGQFPRDGWLAAGYRPRQGEAWWREHGPAMCQAFADWYTSQPGLRVWITPDGRPGIELAMEVRLGAVPIRVTPDVILHAGTAMLLVDIKSGSSTPASRMQLGIQACAIELTYGIRPAYGTFFMAKGVGRKDDDERTYLLPPMRLDAPQYSVAYFTREFAEFDRAVTDGIFLAQPGKQCFTCGVNRACAAFGGEDAARFDPSHPNHTGG